MESSHIGRNARAIDGSFPVGVNHDALDLTSPTGMTEDAVHLIAKVILLQDVKQLRQAVHVFRNMMVLLQKTFCPDAVAQPISRRAGGCPGDSEVVKKLVLTGVVE